MKCDYVMQCQGCKAHVQLPEAGWLQGRVIDWFAGEHTSHLAEGQNIAVTDRLAWACLHAAAYEPTDPMLRSLT